MAKSPPGKKKKTIAASVAPARQVEAVQSKNAAPAAVPAASSKPHSGKAPTKSKASKPMMKKKTSRETKSGEVSAQAKVRIRLASQSAARAGRAMLTPKGLTQMKATSAIVAPAQNPSGTSAPAQSTMTATAPFSSVPAFGGASPGVKRIAFITSECTPLAQTGGLGDMVAGMTKALVKRGHDVRIIMPLYKSIDRTKHELTFSRSCCVHFGLGEEVWVGIFEGKLDGVVPIWFIDYARYFDRPYIYNDQEDSYRFGVLSKAALQVCKDTGWIPDVAHVHDWMTSMAAVFLKTWDRVLSPLSQTASVLTIHNIGYQGKFTTAALPFYGLGTEYLAADRLEDFGGINLLKAGIQYADAVTTVSPTYANEIRGPIGGMGMAPYINNRSPHVFGILNGVDTTVWNPATDKYLPERFSRENMAGKAACKRALQERFGLTVDPKIPLFGIVSRFAPQKGFDLIRGALPQSLRDMVMQVVVLGTGDSFTENFFRWLHGAYPNSANAHIGFSPEVAHLIEAGSDFFLMPSIYEPCGLNQMYSSLYGALPLVRATGGLDDTVDNYNETTGWGTGFKFWDLSGRALYFTIGWAVSTYFDRPEHYLAMQQQGMAKDFTWDSSARQYESVYEHAIRHRASL